MKDLISRVLIFIEHLIGILQYKLMKCYRQDDKGEVREILCWGKNMGKTSFTPPPLASKNSFWFSICIAESRVNEKEIDRYVDGC